MEGVAAVRRRDLLDLGAVVNMAVSDPKELQKQQKADATPGTSPDPSTNGAGDFVTEKWW